MPNPHSSTALLRGLLLAAAVIAPAGRLVLVQKAPAPIRLFRLVTMRADVLLGLTPHELSALGQEPELERLARRMAEAGELVAWRYVEARGPNGVARLATRGRIAVPDRDALLIERFVTAMPVLPPPA
jgi:hypothetical protein